MYACFCLLKIWEDYISLQLDSGHGAVLCAIGCSQLQVRICWSRSYRWIHYTLVSVSSNWERRDVWEVVGISMCLWHLSVSMLKLFLHCLYFIPHSQFPMNQSLFFLVMEQKAVLPNFCSAVIHCSDWSSTAWNHPHSCHHHAWVSR